MALKVALTSIVNALVRKKSEELAASKETGLTRCLSTLDLTFIGVGYTIGAGIFVLTGEVARYKAGPAIVISFLIAGIACLFSAICYAEFGVRFPKAGSAYVYCYVSMGEFCAFIIGWTIVLEYIIGGATIVKGLAVYIDYCANDSIKNETILLIGKINIPGFSSYLDILSVCIVVILTLILALGIKNSARLTNVLITLIIITLTIVAVAGFVYSRKENWKNFMPFGFRGVLQGAATCFFGFIGFDTIAVTCEEAKNPEKSIPISIFGTIIISIVAYIGVSAAVTLMVPYYELHAESAIASVFVQRHVPGVVYVVTTGIIIGMFGNAFVSLIATPRLLYSMANDGLIPGVFAKIGTNNIPLIGTIISNVLIAFIAAFIDIKSLVEMMSIGSLLAYSIVPACVMVLRYRLPLHEHGIHCSSHENSCPNMWHKMEKLKKSQLFINMIILLVVLEVFAICVVMNQFSTELLEKRDAGCIILLIALLLLLLACSVFLTRIGSSTEGLAFSVPFVPWTPIIALFFNISLMLQLSNLSWIRFAVWTAIGLIIYFCYGIRHSMERESSEYIPLEPFKDENENMDHSSIYAHLAVDGYMKD